MTLFINNFVTNQKRTHYNRLNLPVYNRFDIWKYTLASYSVLPITQVICYSELDADFSHHRDELDDYVKDLFPDIPVSIYHTRNTKQSQWLRALEEVTSDLVWLATNDDHPFLDYSLSSVNEAMELLRKEEFATCYYSHWPEIIRVAQNSSFCHDLEDHGNFVSFKWDSPDSIQIFTRKQLVRLWSTGSHEHKYLPRPDWIEWIQPESYKCYVPITREWCRHFDGYSHIQYDQTWCPPLTIPEGFFENNICIRHLSDDKIDGYINVNPLSTRSSKATDPLGPDYHFLCDEMPWFWRPRAKTILVESAPEKATLVEARNRIHELKARSPHVPVGAWSNSPPVNEEWIRRGFI